MGHLDIWVDAKKQKRSEKLAQKLLGKKEIEKHRTISWFGYYLKSSA